MSCLDENTALALVMGELTADRAEHAQAHLANCQSCRKLTSVLAADSSLDALAATVDSPADSLWSAPTVDDRGSSHAKSRTVGPSTRIGRYVVSERLGAGGMGAVFLADDLELHRKVAIKLMHSSTPQASERMLQEARSMAKLRHPNVVTVYDVGREGEDVYVAMEYIAGTTLRKWLRSKPSIQKRIEVIAEAGKGLVAAHEKVLVHRDFKPDNIMVGDDGRVQVLDFGLAKAGDLSPKDREPNDEIATASPNLTRTGALVGTPAYMAPEQFSMGATDARTDQFAFCAVLFEALHGERPFSGDTLEALADSVISGVVREVPPNSTVPPALAAAITRGLAAKPSDRFESMASLLEVLEKSTRPIRKRRRGLALASVGLVAAGAALGTMFLRAGPAEQTDPFAEILANSDLAEIRAEPLDADPFEVTVHRLSNGLTVYISPNHERPVITAQMVVRAGSRDDPAGRSGVAHLAERMMFQGTEQLGTTDYEGERRVLSKLRLAVLKLAGETTATGRENQINVIDQLSVDAAKFAIPDEFTQLSGKLGVSKVRSEIGPRTTSFSSELPSERFSQWALLEGERWSKPVPRLFQQELADAIAEQRANASADRDPIEIGDLTAGEVYGDHAYGRNPRGEFGSLEIEMLPQVEAFLAQRYVPNNAALVLVGDIDVTAAIPLLEKAFSAWSPRPLAAHPHSPPPRRTETVEVERLGSKQRYAGFLGHEDSQWNPRAGAVLVLERLVDSPELFASPETLTGVVDVRFGIDRDRGSPGWFLLVLPEANQTLSDALAVVDRRLAAIESGQYEHRHLDGILERFRLRMLAMSSDSKERVQHIAEAYALGGSWPHRYQAIDGVTVEEVAQLARTLRRNGRVVLKVKQGDVPMSLPDTRELPSIATAKGEQSSFATKVLATKVAERPMRFFWPGRDYNIRDTPSGELITVASHNDEIFEVTLQWDLGWRTLPGLCLGLWSLDDVGIGQDSAEARKRRWSKELFTAQVRCGSNTASVQMRGPKKHFSNVKSVLELLRGDQLTDAIVGTVAERHIGRRPAEMAASFDSALLEYALAGSESLFLTLPTTQQWRGTSVAAVKKALARLQRSKRRTLYLGGDASAIEPFVDVGEPLLEPPARPPTVLVQPEQTRFILHHSGVGRDIEVRLAKLRASLPSEKISEFDVYLALAAARFRETFSPLGIDVEAYGWPVGRPEDGAVQRLSFSAKAVEILDRLNLVESAIAKKVSAKEVELARGVVEAKYRSKWISTLDLASAVATWRENGHDGDPRPQRFAALEQLGVKELEKMAAKFRAVPRVIVISGDLTDLDREPLRAVGEVVELKTSDLFSQ